MGYLDPVCVGDVQDNQTRKELFADEKLSLNSFNRVGMANL